MTNYSQLPSEAYTRSGAKVKVPDDYNGHNPPLFDSRKVHINPQTFDVEQPGENQRVSWVLNEHGTAATRTVH